MPSVNKQGVNSTDIIHTKHKYIDMFIFKCIYTQNGCI